MRYFEDRHTGSIYTLTQLADMLLSEQVRRSELSKRFTLLPETTCALLDRAESIAERAERKNRFRSL